MDRLRGSKGLYNQRGKSSDYKLLTDIIAGCMGEYAVYKHLKSSGIECSKPDLKIYGKGEKSFDSDLKSGESNIHVKSQTIQSVKRYGNSWLLQRSDPLYKSPTDNDILAFTEVNVEDQVVDIIGFCNATDIADNELWAECKVPRFRRTKIALYLVDFSCYDIIRAELLNGGKDDKDKCGAS